MGVPIHRSIVFACDAGMGSSIIGATILRRKLRDAELDVNVTHAAIAELGPADAIVVVHTSLAARARQAAPDAAVYMVDDFIHSPVYDTIVDALRAPTPSSTQKAPA